MSELAQALARHARERPGTAAVVVQDGQEFQSLSYLECWQRVRALSAALAHELPTAQHCLLVENDNSCDRIGQLIAALGSDLPVALVDSESRGVSPDELVRRLHELGYSAVTMAGPGGAPRLAPVGVSRPGPADPSHRSALDHHSLLLPSGGTTGRLKLVANRSVRAGPTRPASVRLTRRLRWERKARHLVLGRLSHAGPLTFLLFALFDGRTTWLHQGFDPARLLDTIAEQRIEWLGAPAYHLSRLTAAAAGRDEDRSAVSSLDAVVHLGGHCGAGQKRYWHRRVGADRVIELYGGTEGFGITIATGQEWEQRPGTVGRGYFTQVKVLDEAGRPVPIGAEGLIYLRSSGALRAAGTGPAAGRPQDGYASLGDRGWLDADGYLYLSPRQYYRLDRGSNTVDLDAIEAELAEHPAVLDAAVAAVSTERRGSVLIVLAVLDPVADTDEQALRAWLKGRTEGWALPARVHRLPAIPRHPSGKLDRPAVHELARQCLGAADRASSDYLQPIGKREP